VTKLSLKVGSVVDGYRIEGRVHVGGMSTLWQVSHSGETMPMLMKVPKLSEGEDPAAIVSFEMEQMILPRLSGLHVPKFLAVGNLSVQPYIVMERIVGKTLLARLPDLPLPYADVAEIGARIASALDELHRQNTIHLDVKPSNIMFRPTGEAVLLDFGLSHHDHLPDLLQEEYRVPFGTAPYMSPEQLLGQRHDRRSDLFALGVLLYFFSTGVRPFGESETMLGMRRRIWRDPIPPRRLNSDYPAWLQEIVLRCLESQPSWRYPTAGQLAFDLRHQRQVKLTARSERLRRDPLTTVLRRRFNKDLTRPRVGRPLAADLATSPIVAIGIDLADMSAPINDALRATSQRILATLPSARLACLNVLKLGRIALDSTLDEHGHNKHLDRLAALKHWAAPLRLDDHHLSVHVLEDMDPASAILKFAHSNRVDHILVGARQGSLLRKLLGSVSSKIVAEASCTVTVVRPDYVAAPNSGASKSNG
jgi:serine/threonine protein kinase